MDYTKEIDSPKQRRLAAVIRSAGDIIRIGDAATALSVSRDRAAQTLSRWTEQGWLRRVGRGAYIAVPVESLGRQNVLDDPWILVPALYNPAYIGGRTAAEHWGLTEQSFRDIVVLTAQIVRQKTQERQGAVFTLKHIRQDKIFGTRPVWRQSSKVPVSDLHRTVVDILDDPALGGGIRHAADCLNAYLDHAERDDETLFDYAVRLGNGAVFKRLGFLVEKRSDARILEELCRGRLTQGNAKLDPALNCDRLVTRWRLLVPQDFDAGETS